LFLQEFYLLFPVNILFFPTTTLPYSRYIITVNIHVDQVLYFLGFCFGEILSQHQFYLLFTSSNTVNTQYRANHVLVRFCPWEDFIPGRIQSFDLSLHVPTTILSYSMYTIMVNTHIDQVLYFGGILSWGDFVPTTTLPYSMYTITVNTLMDQVLYFGGILSWGDFVPTLILSSLYVSHYGKHSS
jgi:hypothetical protein